MRQQPRRCRACPRCCCHQHCVHCPLLIAIQLHNGGCCLAVLWVRVKLERMRAIRCRRGACAVSDSKGHLASKGINHERQGLRRPCCDGCETTLGLHPYGLRPENKLNVAATAAAGGPCAPEAGMPTAPSGLGWCSLGGCTRGGAWERMGVRHRAFGDVMRQAGGSTRNAQRHQLLRPASAT